MSSSIENWGQNGAVCLNLWLDIRLRDTIKYINNINNKTDDKIDRRFTEADKLLPEDKEAMDI